MAILKVRPIKVLFRDDLDSKSSIEQKQKRTVTSMIIILTILLGAVKPPLEENSSIEPLAITIVQTSQAINHDNIFLLNCMSM